MDGAGHTYKLHLDGRGTLHVKDAHVWAGQGRITSLHAMNHKGSIYVLIYIYIYIYIYI